MAARCLIKWLPLVCLGCGRIAFDSISPGDAVGDAAGAGDVGEVAGDGASDGSTDGFDPPSMGAGETCANPKPIALGMQLTGESMLGATDDHGPMICGADGVERIYSFSGAQFVEITITASFSGGIAVGGLSGTSCFAGACTSFSAGVPETLNSPLLGGPGYVSIDRTSGTGDTYDLVVVAN